MRTILISFFLFGILSLNAQTLSATYKVTKDILNAGSENQNTSLPPLEFTGNYFMQGKRVISYLTPDYLDRYPTGKIESTRNDGPNNYSVNIIPLCTDSIIGVNYSDGDSLIWRYTSYVGGANMQRPSSFKYEVGFKKWVVLNETKDINGLICQRAVSYMEGNQVEWDIWFYPDISVDRGFENTFGVPGLIVEGVCPPGKLTMKLLNYALGAAIPDSIFWPELFNQPFVHRGTIKNKNKSPM